MKNSLLKRTVLLSGVWIAITLLTGGLMLRYLYRDHISSHFDAHVFSHVEELVSAILVDKEGTLRLAWQPTDPRFHIIGSGWYWEIIESGVPKLKSHSLGDFHLNLVSLKAHEKHEVRKFQGPHNLQLRAQWMEVNYPEIPSSLMFVVTAPETPIGKDVTEFYNHILTTLLAVGLGLMLTVMLSLKSTLKPLKRIRAAIGDVQAGKIKRVPDGFSSDIQPVVDEINQLLERDEKLLKSARRQLGDLAHAIKNPLTVIRNEARAMADQHGQLVLEQSHIMDSSIDYHLSMARLYSNSGSSIYTEVKPIIEDLFYVVEHVYQERDIEIQIHAADNCWFRGETQDLEEMVGNLMDNACKWAKSRVSVQAKTTEESLILTVEDDGPGIPEESLQQVFERGRKLDETKPGSGQGLGIVKDIVESYRGIITLSRSLMGGLQVQLQLPKS